MADTSNILKEAIADAKAVRHTALMNAKAALEEAFDNRLEAMFSPSLEEDTAEEATPQVPMSPVNGVQPGAEGMVHETDIEEIMRELEQELPQAGAPAPGAPPMGAPGMEAPGMGAPGMGAPGMGAPPMAPDAMAGAVGAPPPGSGMPAVTPPAPAPGPEMGGEAPAPAPEAQPKDEEEMDEEIDVNELLESLKREEEEEEEEMDENTLNEETELKASGIGGGKAGGSANKEPTAAASSSSHAEDGHHSVDGPVGTPGYKKTSSKDATVGSKRPNEGPVTKTTMSTPALTKEAKNIKSGKVGFPGGKKTSGGDDATEGVTRPNEGPVTKNSMETPALKKENVELKAKLQEAEEGVTYLRKQLNEVNLLTAKLLYTNKLFKEYSMNNSKKMKIVEMFDLSQNVREVKMTYAVIAESLNFGADFKKKPHAAPRTQNLTEGMASRPVAGTAPDRQLIAESAKSEMVSKFQRLAGIKIQQPTKKQ